WRTDAAIAPGGYFDDLACHGLDLFQFLIGDFTAAAGFSLNRMGLYSAKDAITGCWTHENGVTGSGGWNFGCAARRDRVEILGSTGTIEFSVFDDKPVRLTAGGASEEDMIKHPKHVQLPHVQAMRDDLFGRQPYSSTGVSAARVAWVMDEILKKI
ncbi:MAG TPA: hypothetical protein VJ904_09980, partial [Tichowtungia sp.]|nr:hypothetical protein [Tichowtungia sp.]